MAKSLKCGECGVLLRSVAEAQAHNDATGHTSFEETLEVIKIMSCNACGKPCRTDAERELHTKYTGHADFSDKTNEASTINTEKEMRAARSALQGGGGASSSSAASEDKGDQSGTAAAGAEGSKGAEEEEGAKDAEQAQELVEPEVDAALLAALEEMGFTKNRCVRALHFSGAKTADEAIAWLDEHESEADLDDPLFVPKESESSKGPALTPVEAKRKAEELVRRAKENRERQERETERRREAERIRAGKEMQKIRAKEDDQALHRLVELRAREKAEAQKAREELRQRLEEDRLERRRRLGLPEELTEEEKAAEAERRRKESEEAAAKKAASGFNYVKPVTAISKMRDALVAMKKASLPSSSAPGSESGTGNSPAFETACSTLMKYLGNVAAQPNEDKFRNIPVSGKAFSQRVGSVPGGVEFLVACGFELEGEGEQATLRLPKDRVDLDLLRHAGAALQEALTNPFFGAL